MRDLIPQIIREDGAEPVTYIAGREEYRGRLRDKLGEEVAEFLEADEDSAPDPGLEKGRSRRAIRSSDFTDQNTVGPLGASIATWREEATNGSISTLSSGS
ncbi:nucleoside triphosphate pyrophosphohydrolase [Streptomyces sp. NPDC006995]|uniref:nucleoside triphosphate pyrophosphohydrolase n=1 Tax=unclassified Streptomyces TaxID=2593676 RepID=UPI003406132F